MSIFSTIIGSAVYGKISLTLTDILIQALLRELVDYFSQEILAEEILPQFEAESHKFQSAGREDIDVRGSLSHELLSK